MKKEKHYDRLKAVRRASRDMAGPHGRGGPHRNKSERRSRRMSTKDWLAETVEEDGRMYWIDCLYSDDRGHTHSLGSVTVMAHDEKSAVSEAIDRAWDPRLEASGCSPCFAIREVEGSP